MYKGVVNRLMGRVLLYKLFALQNLFFVTVDFGSSIL